MIRIRCPKCQNILSVSPELANQIYVCEHCQTQLRVPEVKPPAPPPPAPVAVAPSEEIILLDEAVAKPPAVSPEADSFEAFWERSDAVRKGLKTLTKREAPSLDDRRVAALPANLPEGAEAIGKSLASLGVQQPIGWFNIVLGVFFGVPALASLVVMVVMLFSPIKPGSWVFVVLGGIGVFLVLTFLALVNLLGTGITNSKGYRFWICERGLLWQQKKKKPGFALWEDIEEIFKCTKTKPIEFRGVYVVIKTTRKLPFVTLKIDNEFTDFILDIYGSEDCTSRFAHYILHQACVAAYRKAMRQIFARETVAFGSVEVDWNGLSCDDQTWSWSDVKRVDLSFEDFMDHVNFMEIKLKLSREPVSLDAGGICFPYTALAVCKTLIAERGSLDNLDEPTKPIQPREPENPFAL